MRYIPVCLRVILGTNRTFKKDKRKTLFEVASQRTIEVRIGFQIGFVQESCRKAAGSSPAILRPVLAASGTLFAITRA